MPVIICSAPSQGITINGNRTFFVGIDLDTSQVHSGGDAASVTYDITVNFV
jgi:hypothetical protein